MEPPMNITKSRPPETTTAILPCRECSLASGYATTAVHHFTRKTDFGNLMFSCTEGHERIWGAEAA
jgi:hypothetical protein